MTMSHNSRKESKECIHGLEKKSQECTVSTVESSSLENKHIELIIRSGVIQEEEMQCKICDKDSSLSYIGA